MGRGNAYKYLHILVEAVIHDKGVTHAYPSRLHSVKSSASEEKSHSTFRRDLRMARSIVEASDICIEKVALEIAKFRNKRGVFRIEALTTRFLDSPAIGVTELDIGFARLKFASVREVGLLSQRRESRICLIRLVPVSVQEEEKVHLRNWTMSCTTFIIKRVPDVSWTSALPSTSIAQGTGLAKLIVFLLCFVAVLIKN